MGILLHEIVERTFYFVKKENKLNSEPAGANGEH